MKRETKDTVAEVFAMILTPLLFLMLLTFAMLVLCSCSHKTVSTEDTPVPERVVERHDTLRTLRAEKDTVLLRDSVFTYVSGDTVRIYKERTRYRVKLAHDTVHNTRIRVDSVPVIQRVTVTKTVEKTKPLPAWKKALMWLGAVSIVLLGLSLYGFIKDRRG